MSNRITQKDLEYLVGRINELTDSPTETVTKQEDGSHSWNIGNYHLNYAYGGVQLVRTCSNGGGVSQPLGGGFRTKRELYDKLYDYIRGLQFRRED